MKKYGKRISVWDKKSKTRHIQKTFVFTPRAEMAWGLIGRSVDNPDNTNQPAKNLVGRCFDITDLFFERCEKEGDIIELPDDSER